jgi:hypothetical protein
VSTGGGSIFIALFGLFYLAAVALAIAAGVIVVVSLVRIARATERIARALEQRPPP